MVVFRLPIIYTEKCGVITIYSATDAIAFFQNNNFVASDHVEKLVPKFTMNEYIALYMVTMLNYGINKKYSYSRKRSQIRLKNEKIFLPCLSNGEVDYQYMENYIKSLEVSKIIL